MSVFNLTNTLISYFQVQGYHHRVRLSAFLLQDSLSTLEEISLRMLVQVFKEKEQFLVQEISSQLSLVRWLPELNFHISLKY